MSNTGFDWGTGGQAITITLNSLASSATAGQKSVALDFSALSPKAVDVFITLNIAMPTSGTPANDKAVYAYLALSSDDGTTYDDGATSADAAFTHSDPPNLVRLGVLNFPASNVIKSRTFSVAAACGGSLPKKAILVVRNYTGLTLRNASNSAWYQAVLLNTA